VSPRRLGLRTCKYWMRRTAFRGLTSSFESAVSTANPLANRRFSSVARFKSEHDDNHSGWRGRCPDAATNAYGEGQHPCNYQGNH
jgi:hypothetical protein